MGKVVGTVLSVVGTVVGGIYGGPAGAAAGGALGGAIGGLIDGEGGKGRGFSADERARLNDILDGLAQSRELQRRFLPELLNTVGFKYDEHGKPVKMGFSEFMDSLDPTMRGQFENLELIQDYLGKALRGETGASAGLESDISYKRAQLEEKLNRDLGPYWQQSTSGIQAMSQFDKDAELLREQSRQGIIGSYANLQNAMAGSLSRTPSSYAALLEGISRYPASNAKDSDSTLNYFLQNRNMELQYLLANEQMNQQENANLYGSIGQLGGQLFGDQLSSGNWFGNIFGNSTSTTKPTPTAQPITYFT